MLKYAINGGKPLNGKVKISGSKNAALPILAATLLTKDEVILKNVPVLRDIQTMVELLVMLGKRVRVDDGRMIISSENGGHHRATYEVVKKMRASIVVLGPLLARYGKAEVSMPGGCAFGPRPVDLHIRGMEELGAKVEIHHGYIAAEAEKLQGKSILLAGKFGPSVLGTDNVAMAATLAEGSTVIHSAAKEPETSDLMHFLNAMGANVSSIGSDDLVIDGVSSLHGCEYNIIPDRIEAITYLLSGLVTGGEVEIAYESEEHIHFALDVLESCGVELERKAGSIKASVKDRSALKAANLITQPYPRFPTDMHPVFMVLASILQGESSIKEVIYPTRFNHVPELQRMGANIRQEANTAIIKPVDQLEGALVQASDLRAGAALVLAGLAAKGRTEVHRVYHIERGYENMVEKLQSLGADIQKEKSEVI